MFKREVRAYQYQEPIKLWQKDQLWVLVYFNEVVIELLLSSIFDTLLNFSLTRIILYLKEACSLLFMIPNYLHINELSCWSFRAKAPTSAFNWKVPSSFAGIRSFTFRNMCCVVLNTTPEEDDEPKHIIGCVIIYRYSTYTF